MKQNFKLLQTKLSTTLTLPALQKIIETHLQSNDLLNSLWLVPSSEHAFELHGLNLHGRIQVYHFCIPDLKQEAIITLEFCKGDEAIVAQLVKSLTAPEADKIHTKKILGEKCRNSDSELAAYLTNFVNHQDQINTLHITSTAIEMARHCSWFNEAELTEELDFLTELHPDHGNYKESLRQRKEQVLQVWPQSKTIWFRGSKIKLCHQAHIVCSVTDAVLALHFAYLPQTKEIIIGYMHQYNDV